MSVYHSRSLGGACTDCGLRAPDHIGAAMICQPRLARTPERTPADYAIEFGEYLAKAAVDYMELAGERSPDLDTLRYRFLALSSAIYEFRKRAARAKAGTP